MHGNRVKTRAASIAEDLLLQEVIGLRACLHRMGLNASDRDILQWLSVCREIRLVRGSGRRPGGPAID